MQTVFSTCGDRGCHSAHTRKPASNSKQKCEFGSERGSKNARSKYGVNTHGARPTSAQANQPRRLRSDTDDANEGAKKPILIELSLFFDPGSVLIYVRDSGKLFDITDSEQEIEGISGIVLSGIIPLLDEKAYLVTTGYNRHMVRFTQD